METFGSATYSGQIFAGDIQGFQSRVVIAANTTLAPAHFGNVLVYSGTTDITLTIPDSIDLDAPLYGGFGLQSLSTGKIILAGAAGVEVGFGTYVENEIVLIRRVAENYYANENLTHIREAVSIQVSTTGSATPVNPLRGVNAFALPSQAADFLRQFHIRANVTVTIANGVYTEAALDISHPDNQWVTWQGATSPPLHSSTNLNNTGGANREPDALVVQAYLGANFPVRINLTGKLTIGNCPVLLQFIFFNGDVASALAETVEIYCEHESFINRCAFYGTNGLVSNRTLNVRTFQLVLCRPENAGWLFRAPGKLTFDSSFVLGAAGGLGIEVDHAGATLSTSFSYYRGGAAGGFRLQGGQIYINEQAAATIFVQNNNGNGVAIRNATGIINGVIAVSGSDNHSFLADSSKLHSDYDLEINTSSNAADAAHLFRASTLSMGASQITLIAKDSTGTVNMESRADRGSFVAIRDDLNPSGAAFSPAVDTVGNQQSIFQRVTGL